MPTEINASIADARRRFRAAGIQKDEAALDARLLAQHVLGWDAARVLTHGDQPGPEGFAAAYEALVVRRVAREPLAYITGTREFWNLAIEVTPAVLVPRPETELLVEVAVEHFEHSQALRILDLCTGSGCVAIALGREFPKATILASDISEAALEVARRNVTRHGMTSRITCIQSDLLASVTGPFDLIVANPPYIPASDAGTLPPEVREFEPPSALFGGHDGLQLVRRLVSHAPALLARDGLLIFEFGAGQDEAVEAIVRAEAGLTLLDVKHDLQDIPRAALAQKA
jgi:release factor glutamine methyltransferase